MTLRGFFADRMQLENMKDGYSVSYSTTSISHIVPFGMQKAAEVLSLLRTEGTDSSDSSDDISLKAVATRRPECSAASPT